MTAIQNDQGVKHFATLSTMVYHRLRDQIVGGSLRPGSQLIKGKISKQLGVSPIPVTEAILRLEGEGLVEIEPMFGARVRMFTEEGLRNVQAVREAIECQAARYCAERATPHQLTELAHKADHVDELLTVNYNPSSQEGIQLHLDFHLSIARASGYPLLEKELQRIGFQELMLVKWITASIQASPGHWHAELIASIAKGNSDDAEVKMRQHVRYGSESLLEALKKAQQEGASPTASEGLGHGPGQSKNQT